MKRRFLGKARPLAPQDVPTVAESGYPGGASELLVGRLCAGRNPEADHRALPHRACGKPAGERVAKQLTEMQQMTLVLCGRMSCAASPASRRASGVPWCATTTSGPMNDRRFGPESGLSPGSPR